jgi:Dyp-type peroxidase family
MAQISNSQEIGGDVGTVKLDLDQVQGNIIPGFLNDFQQFLFVRFPSGTAARRWLAELFPEVSSAREIATFSLLRQLLRHPPKVRAPGSTKAWLGRPDRMVSRFVKTTWINVGLSGRGCRIIAQGGVVNDEGFPKCFTQGMYSRAWRTGDGREQMADWEIRDCAADGVTEGPQVAHALLILGADTVADLDREIERQRARIRTLGLDEIAAYRGQSLGNQQEHFGFRDGISQPGIDLSGLIPGSAVPEDQVRPGEFILGQTDETGDAKVNGPTWAESGSYLVFRKLEQHVGAAREDVRKNYAVLRQTLWQKYGEEAADRVSESLLAAKLVGRWPSGAKLVKGQEVSDPFNPYADVKPRKDRLTIDKEDFDDDRLGETCPLFAHVRRAHPRRLPDGDDPNRHRILRRGIAYGPRLPQHSKEDNIERGLLFLAYQADIERQFETIQGDWMNRETSPEHSGDDRRESGADVVSGMLMAQSSKLISVDYHTPSAAKAIPLNFKRFVTVKGGAYFFVPAIGTLALLSRDKR